MMTGLMTIEDVQAELRCGRARVFQLIASGSLPSIRPGTRRRLVRRADFEAFLEREAERERQIAGREDAHASR